MTAFEPMSWETYRRHAVEFNAMVNILLDVDSRRKIRRLLGIYEQGGRSDIPIGEVFKTHHGTLLVPRVTMDDANNAHGDEPEDTRQSPMRVPQPVTGDPNQWFEMASRRAQFKVSAQALITSIEAGRERVFLQPGRFTRVIAQD